jgi:GNAT superfamily N-acetyltransferase
MQSVRLRDHLESGDREAIEAIVRDAAVFRDEEVAVAVELLEIGASDESRGYSFFVAERVSDRRVLGYACFGQAPMTDGVYDLYWIVVSKSEQARGVGGQLLAAVERSVQVQGGRMLLIETEGTPPYEPARRFYLRARYRELARIADYYRRGADKIVYGRSFDGSG